MRENEGMEDNPYQSPEPVEPANPTSSPKPIPVAKVAFSVLARLLGLYMLAYGTMGLAHGFFLGLGWFESAFYSPAEYLVTGAVECVLGLFLLLSAPSIAQAVFGRFDW